MSTPTSQHRNPPHADGDGADSPPFSASCAKPPRERRARDIVHAKLRSGQGLLIATSAALRAEETYRLPGDIPAPSLTSESESTTLPDSPIHTPRLGGNEDENMQGDFVGSNDWLKDLTPLHQHVLLLKTTIRMDQLRASYLEARYCITFYNRAHIRYRKLMRVLEMTPREDSGRIARLEGQRDRASDLFFTYAEKADRSSETLREFEELAAIKEVLAGLIESAEQERMERRVEEDGKREEEEWWWSSRFITHPVVV